MTITIHAELVQGTQQWLDARTGLLTASEMGRIITPKLAKAANDKSRAHVYEIAAQRISKYVDPSYMGDDMYRGQEDEMDARELYREHYGEVEEVGFITNDRWGFTIGYSPDGLVSEDGSIEAKSRRQHFHVKTITSGLVPDEHVIQVQTGLLVSERKWLDYISYSAGLPMAVIRVEPDPEIQEAIVKTATAFEAEVAAHIEAYNDLIKKHGYRPTARRVEREINV